LKVRQIDHVLDLLEVYAREKTSLTLTGLSKALGIPKSSAFNVIDTLVARGFLYETRPRGGYYPTARLFDLSRTIMEGDPLIQRIHGELQALAAATGETAVLSARDQDDAVYVDVVESALPIRYFAKVGERRPIHVTSSGKAILTTYDAAERETILQSLSHALSQSARKRDVRAIAEELEQSKARGWCEDRAESTPDVMGLGVPIHAGERRFGLALAGPLYRMQDNRKFLVEHLIDAARRAQELMQE
jgi:IclR family acetate operon transcriptional repressor